MATIEQRRERLQKKLKQAQWGIERLDARIGELMSSRVTNEEVIADCLSRLDALDNLQRNLPKG